MDIKVLGTGCAKCVKLEQMVRNFVVENNIDAQIEKVEEIRQILTYGVMTTPALVVNGNVVLKGKLPKEKELIHLLKE